MLDHEPAWLPTSQHYVAAAAFLLGDPALTEIGLLQLPGVASIHLAFHAPFASFGYEDTARETLVEQAAVLLKELIERAPLPRDNRRVAFVVTARFLEENGLSWGTPEPDIDAAMIEQIANGTSTESEVVTWITKRTTADR